jgi:hypothetical protein
LKRATTVTTVRSIPNQLGTVVETSRYTRADSGIEDRTVIAVASHQKSNIGKDRIRSRGIKKEWWRIRLVSRGRRRDDAQDVIF